MESRSTNRSTNLSHGSRQDEVDRSTLLAEGSVTLDTDRRNRCGYPEVVYGEGKSAATIAAIFSAQIARSETPFATRIAQPIAQELCGTFPNAIYNDVARTISIPLEKETNSANASAATLGSVAVITAGTTDLSVAEEAAETLVWMGAKVIRVNDVGVAGPHRLPSRLSEFVDSDALVVVAGMEGALPSVVAGYVSCPVIAVPTSVGYGANFGGASALLSMINSCAANVAVVNIDAGFKAGYLAGIIAKQSHQSKINE